MQANGQNGHSNGNPTLNGIISFQIDEPVILALKFERGKDINTDKLGQRVMFTTADGKVFFVYPPDAERIHQLGLRPGEPFELTPRRRADGGKGAEYHARRLNTPGQPPPLQSAPQAQPVQQPTPAPERAYDKQEHNLMIAAVVAAVDAAVAGERHAKTLGRDLRFTEQQISEMGISIYAALKGGSGWTRN